MQRRFLQEWPRAHAARNHEDVRWRTIFRREVRHDLEAIAGTHAAGLEREREGVERLVILQFVGEREDFERPGEVENLDVVEDKNGDIFLHL